MKKPIYLKVVEVNGNPQMVGMPNQTYDEKGEVKKVETDIIVTIRAVDQDYSDGEIWATDALSIRRTGWYVAGPETYKITDDVGIIETTYKNKQHEEWCSQYQAFVQGKGIHMPEEEEPVIKNKKLSLLEVMMADKKLKPPTIEDDGWYIDEELWYYLLRNFKKRKSVLMVGPSGAGKTDTVQMLISKIKKTLNIFDMAVVNPSKTFCGNLRAENGSTYFQLARFANVIQHEGMVLMDELSRAASTANNIFLPVLDKRRTLYIEDAIAESEQQIKVHDDCMFWSTANIGTEFIGTSTLDHALMNRFLQVAVTYPPRDKESLLIQKIYGLDRYTSDSLADMAGKIRDSHELSKDISTRQLFEVAEMVQDGYTPVQACKLSILEQFEGSLIDGGEKASVLAIIQGM